MTDARRPDDCTFGSLIDQSVPGVGAPLMKRIVVPSMRHPPISSTTTLVSKRRPTV
jgi:hypothetical protein